MQRWRVPNPGIDTRCFLGECLSKAAKRSQFREKEALCMAAKAGARASGGGGAGEGL